MIDFSVSLNWIYYKARQIDVIETAVLKELIYFKKLWVSTVRELTQGGGVSLTPGSLVLTDPLASVIRKAESDLE